ncbi:MAG: hypothetical protein Q7S74_03780 [Nanoarchaeota archaeon]|nr:hypothetical protein [Nanoarchaeota archaeon]
MKEYRKSKKFKLKSLERSQTPEAITYRKAYQKTPEQTAKRRARQKARREK